jgi:hypothetical protein
VVQACESYRLLRECERHSALTGEPFVEMSFPPETQYQSLPMDWDSYYARRVGQSSASSMSDGTALFVHCLLSYRVAG